MKSSSVAISVAGSVAKNTKSRRHSSRKLAQKLRVLWFSFPASCHGFHIYVINKIVLEFVEKSK